MLSVMSSMVQTLKNARAVEFADEVLARLDRL